MLAYISCLNFYNLVKCSWVSVIALTKDLELELTAEAHTIKSQISKLKTQNFRFCQGFSRQACLRCYAEHCGQAKLKVQSSKLSLPKRDSAKVTQFKIIKKNLPNIQENTPLAKYISIRIGGPAKYFLTIKKKKDLIRAVKLAKRFKLPFFILGEGSNLLIADEGYAGIVIKVQSSKLKIKSCNSKLKVIYAESGIKLKDLLKTSLNRSLTGIEWVAGIPGTIGGAIYGNTGAFGKSMKDIIRKVEVYDVKEDKIKIFKNRDCKFNYRDSIFKKNRDLIIISAVFQLKKEEQRKIKRKVEDYLNFRERTQPLTSFSSGSIFKNVKISALSSKQTGGMKNKNLLKKISELKEFNKKEMIPAGYLIEECGLKGKRIGRAQVSKKHANFIINLDRARAKDVMKLIRLIKQKVKNKFKVQLEEEINFLPLKKQKD